MLVRGCAPRVCWLGSCLLLAVCLVCAGHCSGIPRGVGGVGGRVWGHAVGCSAPRQEVGGHLGCGIMGPWLLSAAGGARPRALLGTGGFWPGCPAGCRLADSLQGGCLAAQRPLVQELIPLYMAVVAVVSQAPTSLLSWTLCRTVTTPTNVGVPYISTPD